MKILRGEKEPSRTISDKDKRFNQEKEGHKEGITTWKGGTKQNICKWKMTSSDAFFITLIRIEKRLACFRTYNGILIV